MRQPPDPGLDFLAPLAQGLAAPRGIPGGNTWT